MSALVLVFFGDATFGRSCPNALGFPTLGPLRVSSGKEVGFWEPLRGCLFSLWDQRLQ